jgi:hypothetical protein
MVYYNISRGRYRLYDGWKKQQQKEVRREDAIYILKEMDDQNV